MSINELASYLSLGVGVVLAILLGVQSSRVGKLQRQMRALGRGAGLSAQSMSLGELVSRQAERLETTRMEVDAIAKQVAVLDTAVAQSVQHVGLVRFNPFSDTGGDQSFAIALLDGNSDGVVISSLHSRTSTRFYAKPVKAGASALSLSDEEMQALQQAREGRKA
ncbi:MAG: DUF4446 family protein [Chloroflexota bacterium]|nr:DUF4446 family protein [Chloroflexota bacterium]